MKTVQVLRYGSVPSEQGRFVGCAPGQVNVWSGDLEDLLFSCRSIEREWLNNKPFESCIPQGSYEIVLGMYYSGDGVGGKEDYPAYVVEDVPDRGNIKIHIANRASELLGCIALGVKFGVSAGEWAVIDSRRAFTRFMATMAGDERARLEISWRVGEN